MSYIVYSRSNPSSLFRKPTILEKRHNEIMRINFDFECKPLIPLTFTFEIKCMRSYKADFDNFNCFLRLYANLLYICLIFTFSTLDTFLICSTGGKQYQGSCMSSV